MRRAARYLWSEQAAIVALTLTAEVCLPITLRPAAPDAWMSLLLPTTIIGVLAAFAIERRRSQAVNAFVAWLVGGCILLLVQVAQLSGALWESLRATTRALPWLLLPAGGTGNTLRTLAAWIPAQTELIEEASIFAGRSAAWSGSLLRGLPSDDPAARAFCLGLGLWLLASWAGWRIARHQDALGGLLPSTVAMALALNYLAWNRWALWLHLTCFLLLLSLSGLLRLTGRWKAKNTDFADSIALDSLSASILIILMIVPAAYAVSNISIKDLVDRLRERQQPTASSAAGAATGAAARPGRAVPAEESNLLSIHPILAGPHLSHQVVMYVTTGDLPPMQHAIDIVPPRYYWRQINYERYTGSDWMNLAAADRSFPRGTTLTAEAPAHYRNVRGEVLLLANRGAGLSWTGILTGSDQPLRVAWRADNAASEANTGPFGTDDIIGAFLEHDGAAQGYSFHAWLPQMSEADLKAAPAAYPADVTDRYLQLPDDLPSRVRSLARDLTAHERTSYDRAIAIERYLRKIPYSVDVPAPPAGRDAVDFFLFDLKKGYCDYYATAMTVLARSAGLPARMVTGYASGSYDARSARYVVTQADAHSWTEIYFTGIGWIEFEPTANQPAPPREGTVPEPEIAQADTPLEKIAEALPRPNEAAIRLVWLTLVLPAVAWCVWLVVDAWRLKRLEPAEATQRLYTRMRRTTRGMVQAGPVGQTALEYASEFAEHLESAFRDGPSLLRSLATPIPGMVVAVTSLHMRGLFAPTPLGVEDRKRAISTWSALRWRLALLRVILPVVRVLSHQRTMATELSDTPAE